MNGFLTITKIIIPVKCLDQAFQFMKYVGERNLEGAALFAGCKKVNTFYVEETIIPKQKAYSLDQGLMYVVDSAELHKINRWLYDNDYSIIAQIHSHPQEAYHSETDDHFSIVTTMGGLSIVVPYFATGQMKLDNWAVFRLSTEGIWKELNRLEIQKLFEII